MMFKIWSKKETPWSFTLCGTAVGTGALFLPVQLGSTGAIVLFITALVTRPLVYWPRKALNQFIPSASIAPGTGITGAVNRYYGKKIGSLITGLYFLVSFVVVLIYAVTITNSLAEQVAHRTPVTPTLHTLLSLGVVLILNLIFLMDQQVTIKVMGSLALPFIACFLFLSLYLIRDWHPEHLTSQMQFSIHTLHQIWISIPVMAFAFNHTPIISTSAIGQQEKHGDLAMGKYKRIMKMAYAIICASVPFFVFSYLLAIPATYIESARDQGVTILSALSMVLGTPGWLTVIGTVVTMVAMPKSFLGAYFRMIKGASEIIKSSLGLVGVRKNRAFNRAMSILLISAFAFAVYFIDPNAISMICAISGPSIVMILSIIPTLPTWLVPTPKPYRSVGNAITLVVGLLRVSVMFFG